MVWTVEGTANGNSETNTDSASITYTATAANNKLIALISNRNGGPSDGVYDSLAAGWTAIASAYEAGGNFSYGVFERVSTATAADGFSCAWDDDANYNALLLEISGLSTDPVEVAGTVLVQTSGTSITANATPLTQPGMGALCLFVQVGNRWENSTSTYGTDYTQGFNTGAASCGASVAGYSTTSLQSGTWSTTDTGGLNHAAVMLLFKEAGGGGVTLSVDDGETLQSIDNVDLSQGYLLSLAGLDNSQRINNLILSQATGLTVQDIQSLQTLGNISLLQSHLLAVDGLATEQLLEGITLSAAGALSVQSVTSSQTIVNLDLLQAHNLVTQNLDQDQALDNTALVQAYSLNTDDISQVQELAAVILESEGQLGVSPPVNAQTLDNIGLVQASTLTLADIRNAQELGNIELDAAAIGLSVDGLSQEQTLDQITLNTAQILQVDDLTQSQLLSIINIGGTVVGRLNGKLTLFRKIEAKLTIH